MEIIGSNANELSTNKKLAKPAEIFEDLAQDADASARNDHLDETVSRSNENKDVKTVPVSSADKAAFIESVITGSRYRRPFSLMGGKLTGTFRCRSVGESEAIYRYLHNRLALGKITTDHEYMDLSRLCMLASQVEEINGVKYEELAEPLMITEDQLGLHMPGWEKQLDIWRAKPEPLCNMLLLELQKFEASYYTMIEASADENFWRQEESIGN